MRRTFYNKLILVILVIAFVFYNYAVYTGDAHIVSHRLSRAAIRGQDIWQKNNCSACHQIYGLGGYLGPDLTNIHSHPSKGPEYIRGILNSGIRHMPEYQFGEREKEALTAFLRAVDSTGYYPNKQARFLKNGWVEIKTK